MRKSISALASTASLMFYDKDDDDDNDYDDDTDYDDDSDNDDNDNVYLGLQHGKGFHDLVYVSYVKHINPAKRHK
jgi:hypothetical protein